MDSRYLLTSDDIETILRDGFDPDAEYVISLSPIDPQWGTDRWLLISGVGPLGPPDGYSPDRWRVKGSQLQGLKYHETPIQYALIEHCRLGYMTFDAALPIAKQYGDEDSVAVIQMYINTIEYTKAGMVKVNVGDEWCWAQKISENLAKLKNTPWLTTDYGFDDLFEFDPESMQVIRLLERCTRTFPIRLTDDGNDDDDQRKAVCQHFERQIPGSGIEWATPHIASLHVPVDTSDAEVATAASSAPIAVELD